MCAPDDNPKDDHDGDSDNEMSGTITLVVGNRENEHPNLIDAYLNGVRRKTLTDTGAAASIIHHSDDPKRDRIFKIVNVRTYYISHRYDVN